MARTGEHPAIPLGDQTPVRLGLVVLLLGAAAAGGAALYRQGAVEKRQEATEAAAEKQRDKTHALELQQQRTADALEVVVDTVKRIDARTERMERGGTRPARGNQ